jgi:hypothetical protein
VRKNCEDDSDDALICQDSATPDCYDSRTKWSQTFFIFILGGEHPT